jgi:hypothetical protein
MALNEDGDSWVWTGLAWVQVDSLQHNAVTLAADADTLLGLTGQQITLDTQGANLVFVGPASGGDDDPTFRALVDADIPAAIARDSELHAEAHAHSTHSGLGDLDHISIGDADGDTKIQVEESADEDIIRFDAGGIEVLTITQARALFENIVAWGTATTKTISSGTITIDKAVHLVDTEGGDPSDDLEHIEGGVSGAWLILSLAADDRDVVIKNTSPPILNSIFLSDGVDVTMNTLLDVIFLRYTGLIWVEVARSASLVPHAALIGLADDDHTQYLLADGTRDLTGALLVTGANELNFRDTTLKVYSSVDGQLDIDADTKLEITAPAVTVSGTLEVGAVQTYTESNVTTDRSFDADATSIHELADVLGTLIADLRTIGLVN